MTCFWDGILKGLNSAGLVSEGSIEKLIEFLKKNNKMTNNIIWNDEKLTEKEKIVNFQTVKNFDIGGIYNGHLCSTCDYFLLLICEIFCIDINHFFLNKLMTYRNKVNKTKRTITFHSDRGHFWH